MATTANNPLGPIDHAIGLIADIKATGADLVRAEAVYQELIDFRRRTTVVEEDSMSEQMETSGQDTVEAISEPVTEQIADTPGNDENGDGLTAGQTTADVHGDVLGV